MCANYKKTNSFEISSHSAAAVGTDKIAVAEGDSAILITSSDRFSFEHGSKITDIALGENLIVLDENKLTGYSIDGDQIWDRENKEYYTISATNNGGTFAALSEDNVNIFNSFTGNEISTINRSRPGDSDDTLLATANGFLYSTWSFLTLVDQTGTQLFDRDLETVIKNIGMLDDKFVVSVQTGKVIGIGTKKGETKFKTELNAKQISPLGNEELFIKTQKGIHAIDPQGKANSRPNLNNGKVYQSGNGDVFCEITDSLIIKYTHKKHNIDLSIHTDEVGVGSTVNVKAKNISGEANEIEVNADLEGCTLAPDQRTCKLESSESEILDFPVSNIHTEGEASFSVTVNDVVSAQKTLLVEDAAIGALGVDPELEISSIEDGQAELEITIVNTGGVVLDRIEVIETNDTTERIKPNESWSTHITRPYEPKRRVTVGVKISRGDREREYAPSCRLPPLPDIDLSTNEEVIQCKVITKEEYKLSDRLVIEIPGAGRSRTPVSINEKELQLLIPQYEDGIARISLETLDVEGHLEVRGSSPFVEPASRTENQTTSRAESSESSNLNTDNKDTESDSVSKTVSANSTETSNADSQTQSLELKAIRKLPDSVPAVGHLAEEELHIENLGEEINELIINSDGKDVSVGPLESGAQLQLRRNIAPGQTKTVNLNHTTVQGDGIELDTISSSDLSVRNSGIGIKTLISKSNNSTKIVGFNNTDSSIKITKQIFQNESRELNEVIPPKSTETFYTELDPSTPDPSGTQRVDYQVASDSGDIKRIKALAKVDSTDIRSKNKTAYDNISVDVTNRTIAGGAYPQVIIDLENDFDRSIRDLTIDASSEFVLSDYHRSEDVSELHANATEDHEIPVEATGDVVEFTLSADFVYEDSEYSLEYVISGKTVEKESEWDESLVDTWSVEPKTDNNGAGLELPDVLSTTFSQSKDTY